MNLMKSYEASFLSLSFVCHLWGKILKLVQTNSYIPYSSDKMQKMILDKHLPNTRGDLARRT